MVKRASLKWLKRFFSSKSQISLPAQVYELLQHGAPVQVQKVGGVLLRGAFRAFAQQAL